MRKGLDFFSVRKTSIDDKISEAQKKMNIVFPPQYKNFLSTYDQGEEALNREKVYKSEYNRWEIAGSVIFKIKHNRPISVYYFFDLEQVMSSWLNIDQYEETGTVERILNIGMLSSDPNGGLYVGFGHRNADKVYRVNWDLGENRFSIVASTIWEFIEGLEQSYGNT